MSCVLVGVCVLVAVCVVSVLFGCLCLCRCLSDVLVGVWVIVCVGV